MPLWDPGMPGNSIEKLGSVISPTNSLISESLEFSPLEESFSDSFFCHETKPHFLIITGETDKEIAPEKIRRKKSAIAYLNAEFFMISLQQNTSFSLGDLLNKCEKGMIENLEK
jgi:hypothetical protein